MVPLWPDIPADGLDASADTEDQPLVEALDQCLADLDADEHEWIESFYFQKHSHQAIAERHQTTPKAVESKLARIRRKLRQAVLKRLKHEDS